MNDVNTAIEISRDDYSKMRIIEEPAGELGDRQVRLQVERFALTANTVTYAVVGEMLDYWGFFPTAPGWGRVPAIGWGRIVESTHPDLGVGSRYYGWFPMARTVDMTVSATSDGLRDDGAHRTAHAPVYRNYTATDRDPFYRAGDDAEDRHILLRGMYMTAFLADDFFADSNYYGAARAVVLSASSKTAIGFAQRAATRSGVEVVGLTSAANAEFVRTLQGYDRVLTYEEVEAIPDDSDAVVIDMAGNNDVLERVHARLADRLRYSMTVGMSHYGAQTRAEPSTGPRPQLFFAPSQIEKRMQDWGAAGYRERVGEALREFVDASGRWLEVARSSGPDAVETVWTDTIGGKVPPSTGHVVSV